MSVRSVVCSVGWLACRKRAWSCSSVLLSEHMLEINAQAFKDDIMNNYQCLDRSDYSLGILGGAHSEDPVCRPVCCQVRSALAYRSRGGGGERQFIVPPPFRGIFFVKDLTKNKLFFSIFAPPPFESSPPPFHNTFSIHPWLKTFNWAKQLLIRICFIWIFISFSLNSSLPISITSTKKNVKRLRVQSPNNWIELIGFFDGVQRHDTPVWPSITYVQETVRLADCSVRPPIRPLN